MFSSWEEEKGYINFFSLVTRVGRGRGEGEGREGRGEGEGREGREGEGGNGRREGGRNNKVPRVHKWKFSLVQWHVITFFSN